MSDSILVLNAGSSSIKFALYPVDDGALGSRLLGGQIAGIGLRGTLTANGADGNPIARSEAIGGAYPTTQAYALAYLLDWLEQRTRGRRIVAAGHRVVHGGAVYRAPVAIDDTVLATLTNLIPIARLHQPYEVAAINALRERDPALLQIACFDTAFHRTQPEVAQLFPLPRPIIDSGVRRYGFHGLSYDYIAGRLPALIARSDQARVVVAHLGSGSSMCALRGGRSIATTMGFTALDGLMMGTRSGSVDPGILLYLIQERGMSVQQVNDMLYKESGLLGVSGLTSDMRVLLESSDPHAREAVELYVYGVVREAGALIACLQGIDALVFTAGIGENAAPIRARVCAALSWLGIMLDDEANARHALCISAPLSKVSVWVIPTDEESVIARHTLELAHSLAGAG